MKNSAKGFALSLAGGILWGFSGSCGQYLFTAHSVSPQWLVPVRMVLTGVILLSISAVKRRGRIFEVWRTGKSAARMAAFTLFGLVLCQYSYFAAIERSNAGVATVLQYLSPAMILVFLCLKNKKLPSWAEFIAVLLAVGGTFMIATDGNFSGFSVSSSTMAWGIASAVFLVCYSIIPGPLLEISDTATVLGWGMLAGGAALIPVFRPWRLNPEITPQLLAALAGIVIFGTVMAYTFYLEGVRLIGAARASIISSIEPVAATVISALWLGTEFSSGAVIGFAMIISTVFIISYRPKKRINE